MKIISDSLSFSTRGFNDIQDITDAVSRAISDNGLKQGIVNIFVPGSTGGLTTIEYESGLIKDFQQIIFVDFDNRSRSRTLALQFIGE